MKIRQYKNYKQSTVECKLWNEPSLESLYVWKMNIGSRSHPTGYETSESLKWTSVFDKILEDTKYGPENDGMMIMKNIMNKYRK